MADKVVPFIDRDQLHGHLQRELGDGDGPQSPFVRPFVWRDPSTIPRREWLYGGHFIRKFITATFAPGAVGKSVLLLTEAMAMASGRPLLGVQPAKRLRVGYWNGEDPIEETERRVAAIMLHFGLTEEDLAGWFFWGSGRDSEIIIAEQTRDGTTIRRPSVERLKGVIRQESLDLAIIDPFIASHRVTENDNNAIQVVASEWLGIADETGCGVELVHHTTKAAIGRETRVEDGRGGGALLFAVRSARVLNTMSQEEAETIGKDQKERRWFFRVDNGKANLAPPPSGSEWRQFRSVELGNGDGLHDGDSVGVVERWEWPENVAAPSGETPKAGGRKLGGPALAMMAAFSRLFDDGKTVTVPVFPGVKPNTRGVTDADLRKMATRLNLVSEPKPDPADKDATVRWQNAGRSAWKAGTKQLTERKMLRFEEGFVWELHHKANNDEQRVTPRDGSDW